MLLIHELFSLHIVVIRVEGNRLGTGIYFSKKDLPEVSIRGILAISPALPLRVEKPRHKSGWWLQSWGWSLSLLQAGLAVCSAHAPSFDTLYSRCHDQAIIAKPFPFTPVPFFKFMGYCPLKTPKNPHHFFLVPSLVLTLHTRLLFMCFLFHFNWAYGLVLFIFKLCDLCKSYADDSSSILLVRIW